MANKMTNAAGVIAFKPNKELVRALRDLQIYYGQTTRAKLLQDLVSEAMVAVWRRKPEEKKLSPEQVRAYKRIKKSVDDTKAQIEAQQARLEEEEE